MTAVAQISAHLNALQAPDELRRLEGWLIWRYEAQPDKPEAKPRKVPYYAGGGKRTTNGVPKDRAQLVTFDAARSAAARRGFDGVGLALLEDFDLAVVDFDDCVGGQGLKPWVADLVADTYAEFSPSGRGVHAVFRRHGLPLADRKVDGFEVFAGSGYVTWTGNVLPHVEDLALLGSPVSAVTPALQQACAVRFGAHAVAHMDDDPLESYSPQVGLTPGQIEEALASLPGDMTYDHWCAVGMAVHHETGGSDEGFHLWDDWSRRSPKYSTPEYGRDRWDSFGRKAGRQVTARSLLKLAAEHGVKVTAAPVATVEQVTKDLGPQKPMKYQLQPAAQFADGPPMQWLVKGVLPKAGLAVIYGEPGSGKTFAVLDVVMAIARGTPWRGARVRQGRVVYVVAEGEEGFKTRLRAFSRHHDVPLEDIDMLVLPAAPNLLLVDDVRELVRAVLAAGPVAVVVIDTLAQTTPGGNENSGEDMGKALGHCRTLHRATGATVVLVHHSGKDADRGARGWSGIKGAADAELEVRRLGVARVLANTKQKDGKDGGQWAFDLVEVPVGVDEDGDVVTSCAVVEASMSVTGGLAKPLGKHEAVVNQVIQEFAQAQTTGIEVAAVLAEAVRRMPAPEQGRRDTRKQHARRALENLCAGDEAPYWVEGDSLTVM